MAVSAASVPPSETPEIVELAREVLGIEESERAPEVPTTLKAVQEIPEAEVQVSEEVAIEATPLPPVVL